MSRSLWFIPLLAAIYTGSCRADSFFAHHVATSNDDIRQAICAASLSFALLLLIRGVKS